MSYKSASFNPLSKTDNETAAALKLITEKNLSLVWHSVNQNYCFLPSARKNNSTTRRRFLIFLVLLSPLRRHHRHHRGTQSVNKRRTCEIRSGFVSVRRSVATTPAINHVLQTSAAVSRRPPPPPPRERGTRHRTIAVRPGQARPLLLSPDRLETGEAAAAASRFSPRPPFQSSRHPGE